MIREKLKDKVEWEHFSCGAGVPVIPMNAENIFLRLSGIEKIYPAWDQEYSFEMMIEKIADAREIIQKLEQTVRVVGMEVELPVLVHQVCDRLHTPMWKENPLFARTIDCCRGRG